MPSELQPSVNGALELLADVYNWETFGTQQPQDVADAMRAALDDYYMSTVTSDINGQGPTIPAWDIRNATTGWQFTTTAGCHTGGVWSFPNNNQNNEVDFGAYLNAGDFKLHVLARTGVNQGIATLRVGNTTYDHFDLYSASGVPNVLFISSTITITTTGLQVVKLKMEGKNASAGGYGLMLQEMRIIPA